MLTAEDVALELEVFRLVDHSIDKDTYDLIFTTRTTNGFENTTRVYSNNPDYRMVIALVARKAYDHSANNVPAYSTGETTSNQGGEDTDSILENDVVIVYDRTFDDYSHNGNVIGKLEVFIAKCLELGNTITIKEL